jgi:hypothetical protein
MLLSVWNICTQTTASIRRILLPDSRAPLFTIKKRDRQKQNLVYIRKATSVDGLDIEYLPSTSRTHRLQGFASALSSKSGIVPSLIRFWIDIVDNFKS